MHKINLGFILILFFYKFSFSINIQLDTTFLIPKKIPQGYAGVIKQKFLFKDNLGSHILLLLRDSTQSKDGTNKITIQAVQFLLKGADWISEWNINDFQSCKDLDISADYFLTQTLISDLDSNGIAESTITYHTLCAGDIEPETVKTIMRQGKEKYAVRGESLIKIEGSKPEGGKYTIDKILETKRVFSQKMVSIWKKAAGIIE